MKKELVPGRARRAIQAVARVVLRAIQAVARVVLVQAAVSPCTGHDLLLGADVIRRLFEAGFRLGAGSM